ncbi:MAG: molecular chaperone TorD family protein [Nitrospirae bacterium]|nr:molecular chaperone TorD family protein [Nitrospirota bacterium]MCL5976800.1 molecular chaperone TorD family protein [Nitrospirota bacterium]
MNRLPHCSDFFSQHSNAPILQTIEVDVNISQQLVDYEQARSNCYKLFAACFYQPQKDIFVRERLFENLSLLLKQACPDAVVFSEEMGGTILNYSNEDLLIDYAKLFVGPNELLAPPYGSVYLDGERRVMGNSTIEVVKTYKDEGLAIDENFKELPDHIAVELEFMYYLIFKEIEALESSDDKKAAHFIEVQEMFLHRFLGRWVKPFCDAITEGTENEFYKALAGCLSTFVVKSAVPDELKALVSEKMQNTLN